MAVKSGLAAGELIKGPEQSRIEQTPSLCPFCKNELNTIDKGWDEDVVCPACGHVVSEVPESTLVSEVEWGTDGSRRPLGQRVSGVTNDVRSARLLVCTRGPTHCVHRPDRWKREYPPIPICFQAKLKQQVSQASVTLHLPASILVTAEGLAAQAGSHGVRGLSTPPVVGALLYLACRTEGAPCTLPDVAAAVNADVGQMRRLYCLLIKVIVPVS